MDIYDAFNDCIDRLNSGESIESCLADYPQFADRLRQLLGTGALVYRAQQYPYSEVKTDQVQLQPRIIAMAHQTLRPLQRRYWAYSLAAVASLAVVVVIALALIGPAVGNVFSNLVKNYDPDYALRVTSQPILVTATSVTNSTGLASAVAIALTDTAVISSPPLVPIEDRTDTPAPTASGIPRPTMTPQPGIVSTSVALMTSSPIEATPLSGNFLLPTAIVGATMPPMTATLAPTQPPLGIQVIPLNAGEIDDNARWDNYLQYRTNFLQQYGGTVHDVDITGRQLIMVMDRQGLPVLGARVLVFAGQTLLSDSRSYATGQTLFFPNANPQGRGAQSFLVHVEKGSQAVEFTLDPSRGSAWNVVLDDTSQQQTRAKLDVLFLLDSTGSMGDEIAQLQNNILSISAQVAQLSGNNVDVRYGLVTYRDRGDVYVTQIDDFVPDVGTFQALLSGVQADGGGDIPESLNEGLHDAIQQVSWRGDDTVKLVFLVADAPPHLDYANDYDYAQEMVVAAQNGIKIHPIASSGITPDGEFIFRQLAEYTMGHFIFLTYDQGTPGTPGDTRPDLHVGSPAEPANQQQGDYTVERLDELVLRLITDELSALKKPAESGTGITPALTPAAPLPAVIVQSPTPSPTWTATPTPAAPVSPSLPPTQTSQLVPGNPQITLSLPVLLSLIFVGLVIGYAFNVRRPTPKRKRKNIEIIEAQD